MILKENFDSADDLRLQFKFIKWCLHILHKVTRSSFQAYNKMMKVTARILFYSALVALFTTASRYQDWLLARWFGIDLIELNYPFWQARFDFEHHLFQSIPFYILAPYIILIFSMVVSAFTLRKHFKQSGQNANWAWFALIPLVNFIAIWGWIFLDTQKQTSGKPVEKARATLYLLGAVGLWYWLGYYFFWLAWKS